LAVFGSTPTSTVAEIDRRIFSATTGRHATENWGLRRLWGALLEALIRKAPRDSGKRIIAGGMSRELLDRIRYGRDVVRSHH
jgi:hypothetical protein